MVEPGRVRTAAGEKLSAGAFLQSRGLTIGDRLESEDMPLRTAAE